MTPRLGKYISGTSGLNLTLTPYEQRPDAARWQGGPVYRVKDVFSTRDGSWEVSEQFGSVDQWAKDAYWSGAKFDGAGGDHNFFIMCLDEAGNPIPGKGLLFWQGPMSADFTPSDPRQAKQDGTENIPVFGSYSPDLDEHGAWSGAVLGKSDVLVGVGMPWNNHVSVFLVLQATAAPAPPVDPDPEPDPGYTALLERIASANERIAAALEYLNAHIWAAQP